MPFKVTLPNGLVVEVDDVLDVIALDRAQGGSRNGKSVTHAATAAEPSRKQTVLSERGTMILKALKKNPDGLLNEQLLEQAQIEAGSLPPVFRGLKNWSTGLGHKLDDFIERDRVAMRDKLVTRFKLTEMGRKAVEKLKL